MDKMENRGTPKIERLEPTQNNKRKKSEQEAVDEITGMQDDSVLLSEEAQIQSGLDRDGNPRLDREE